MIRVIKGVESNFKIVALDTKERKGKHGREWTIHQNSRTPMSQGAVIVMANNAVISISVLTTRRAI